MKAPVWHLIARVSVVSGSTGWHRYALIDASIRHIGDWMLLGTKSTAHWGLGLGDVTNQYILEGVRGGLVSVILFLAILFVAARAVLRLSLRSKDKAESYVAWCLFVTIIAHCVSFLGVSYFGQIIMLWYLLLAAASLAYDKANTKSPRSAKRPVAAVAAPQEMYCGSVERGPSQPCL